LQVHESSHVPKSPAAERNKEPIHNILSSLFSNSTIFEIGSGYGQHAEFFCQNDSTLKWIPSDLERNIPVLERVKVESGLSNFCQPVVFDANSPELQLPVQPDYVFTANTFHIMSWECVLSSIAFMCKEVSPKAFVVYGPFHREGKPTSESNKEFDECLQSQSVFMRIRDLEEVVAEFSKYNYTLAADHTMPANNALLVFERSN
jgi:hypothetical protein